MFALKESFVMLHLFIYWCYLITLMKCVYIFSLSKLINIEEIYNIVWCENVSQSYQKDKYSLRCGAATSKSQYSTCWRFNAFRSLRQEIACLEITGNTSVHMESWRILLQLELCCPWKKSWLPLTKIIFMLGRPETCGWLWVALRGFFPPNCFSVWVKHCWAQCKAPIK